MRPKSLKTKCSEDIQVNLFDLYLSLFLLCSWNSSIRRYFLKAFCDQDFFYHAYHMKVKWSNEKRCENSLIKIADKFVSHPPSPPPHPTHILSACPAPMKESWKLSSSREFFTSKFVFYLSIPYVFYGVSYYFMSSIFGVNNTKGKRISNPNFPDHHEWVIVTLQPCLWQESHLCLHSWFLRFSSPCDSLGLFNLSLLILFALFLSWTPWWFSPPPVCLSFRWFSLQPI